MRKTKLAIAGFEYGGRRSGAKACRPLLEARKSKETESPLEHQGRNTVLPKP